MNAHKLALRMTLNQNPPLSEATAPYIDRCCCPCSAIHWIVSSCSRKDSSKSYMDQERKPTKLQFQVFLECSFTRIWHVLCTDIRPRCRRIRPLWSPNLEGHCFAKKDKTQSRSYHLRWRWTFVGATVPLKPFNQNKKQLGMKSLYRLFFVWLRW